MHWSLVVLVFVALALGWWLGRRKLQRPQQPDERLSKDYFIGLNYLLNEQPDRAVDVFIQMLEVDDQTVETHLALGSLFRRRGEVERAIRIHQNLIARPNLNRDLRIQALVELGRDYLSAGVLDRAERLFQEALETNGDHGLECLQYLRDIYEREKDWTAALKIVERIERLSQRDMAVIKAQYYCELIDDPRTQLSQIELDEYLALAKQADANSPRLGLLEARELERNKDYAAAILIYQNLLKTHTDFASVILPLLQQAYRRNDDNQGFTDFLYKSLEAIQQPAMAVHLAQQLCVQHGVSAAAEFLRKQLAATPSLSALEYWLKLSGDTDIDTAFASRALQQLTKDKPSFRCDNCGLSSKTLHWLCPSCRRWATTKPLELLTTKVIKHEK